VPIYDFKCRECGRVSEVLIRDVSKTVRCPSCHSENMERLVSASYMVKADARAPGSTCCGRAERCDTPPCATGDVCSRDRRR
jgi:putative FmdB family regulatory protein